MKLNLDKVRKIVAWNIYLRDKLIDTIFINQYADGGAETTIEEIKDSLINHDHYNPMIVVRQLKP